MPQDTNYIESNAGRDFPAVWAVPATLRQLAECGDAELVEELIGMFQTDTSSRLEVLRHAVAGRDYAVIGAEAHTIKGSALQVGANRLAEFCRQMEQGVRQTPPLDLAGSFQRILQSFNEVCRVIAERQQSSQLLL
jgi:HPt (histidine-containing phosphotransfer) domain-containing protein